MNDAARNLADIAADKLDRLAEDLAAVDGVDLSAAPALVREQVASTLRDSRVQAAGALERLRAALSDAPIDVATVAKLRSTIAGQHEALTDHGHPYLDTGSIVRGWAITWRAFADA